MTLYGRILIFTICQSLKIFSNSVIFYPFLYTAIIETMLSNRLYQLFFTTLFLFLATFSMLSCNSYSGNEDLRSYSGNKDLRKTLTQLSLKHNWKILANSVL